jgi:hypothetical protein
MSANVTQSIFDVTSAAGAQFLAMLLGAFLASAGGFFVAWLLDRMERKRQERSIALVCLDLVSSLDVITKLADGARKRGDPYGPFTMRLVRGCLRDLDVYERNRERIADISDPDLRAEIYQCMARMNMAVEGILSESELIKSEGDAIEFARSKGDTAKVDALTQQSRERAERRAASFDFMMETTRSLCGPLSEKLRSVARTQAQNLAAIVAASSQPPARAAPKT